MLEDILKEAKKIAAFMSEVYKEDIGIVLMDRISFSNTYLGRLSLIIPEAKYLLGFAKATASDKIDYTDKTMTATKIKMIVEKEVLNEQRVVDTIEKVGTNLVHYHDGLRSQLSYLKTLANNNN